MKVGVSTGTLYPERETEQALKTIAELGLGCAEIVYSTFFEYRPEFSATLKPVAEGVPINSVHTVASNFEENLFSPTRRVRGDGLYWLDQVARSAQLLGCKNYTFHGFNRHILESSAGEDLGWIGERLREAYDFLAHYGVSLCLENVHWSLYNRPGVFKEIKKHCTQLYGVFDIKQARRSGYPYRMYLKELEGAIAYAHLSDVDEGGRCRLPGAGRYDFNTILKELKDAGFDGNIIIEAYRSDYGDLEELKRSYEFLSELCYKLG